MLRLLASVLTTSALVVGCVQSGPTPSIPTPSIPTPSIPTPSIPSAAPINTAAPGVATPLPSTGSSPSASARPIAGLPDPVMTPGATNPAVTQATIGKTICVSGWTAKVRPPVSYTTRLKISQIAAYGYTDTNLAHYEEDHLISLEIGGAPKDPLNLWPEPYAASLQDGTPVGARIKDRFENYLHRLVCGGRMTLGTAQALIAGDWVTAWRTTGPTASPGASG